MSAERVAIQLMVAQGFLFACETALIHLIGSGISVMQLALVRGLGGLMLAVLVAGKLGFSALKTHQLPLQLLRGAVTLLYLWVLIFSFSRLPFADATVISYTQAAYIAIFSVLILGERVTRSRWAAVAVGIGGALLIAKPAFGSWNIAYLVAVAGTSLNGLAFVLNCYLQRRDSETTTMFYTNTVLVVGNAPVLLTMGLPTFGSLAWLPLLMLLGPLGLYLGIVAVKHASAAMLAPYTLVRLLIGVVGGVFLFGELPDLFSALGAALIVGSCALSSWTRARGPAKAHAPQAVPKIASRALLLWRNSLRRQNPGARVFSEPLIAHMMVWQQFDITRTKLAQAALSTTPSEISHPSHLRPVAQDASARVRRGVPAFAEKDA